MSTISVHTPRCLVCGKEGLVEMPLEAFKLWEAGALLQEAWPDSLPASREQLISGTHEKCWNKLMSSE